MFCQLYFFLYNNYEAKRIMKRVDEKYFIKSNDVDYDPTIESVLSADEQILWRSKPKRLSFILSAFFKFFFIALIWGLFDGFAIAMIAINMPKLDWWLILILVIFFSLHLIPVWIWIVSIITASKRQRREEYAFTDKRIIIKNGLIGSNIQSIFYSSITSINLKIGLIERMCKVGDIYITADTTKAIMEDISDPYFIYGQLQKIANDIKQDILYPNALRPDENPGYKTSYKGDINFKK